MSKPTGTKSDSARGDAMVVAGQWTLMWWRFRRHKLAVAAGFVVLSLYLVAAFSGFVAPYRAANTNLYQVFIPPQPVRWHDANGVSLRPFVTPYRSMRHPVTAERLYETDPSRRVYLRFFVRGDTYKLFGLFPCSIHLFGGQDGERVHILGTDSLGRDFFSCVVSGATISLSIGLVGVLLSFLIGAVMGTISGYFGGRIDNAIQRLIEFINAFPKLPLWMALAAALPPNLSPLQVYFCITLILSMIGWTGLARVVRGKILALREEDYAMAAELAGCTHRRIMFVHLLPGFASHMIVSISMSVPRMIGSETSLSFLGIGIKPPAISWGLLLNDALDFDRIINTPWVLTPVLCVMLTVFAFNFLGDGLRDAADPYGQ
jgi:peptide/nickel transport system permease protein